ncbi:hypothetical protein [Pontixanthobacter sp. CEM42]|uniref:hypothetical protein n=1 Tax=Pontixanthobacter sp. CEM42 TaxID=2792077 RepID=UPI001FD7A3E5|nr:hypothetical protein [Pontixanthobacter sp. CEM42]
MSSRLRYQGAQDYIRKPFDEKFLVWRVNQVLKSRAERPKHMELQELMERNAGRFDEPVQEDGRTL